MTIHALKCENVNDLAKQTRKANIGINLVDIFKDTTKDEIVIGDSLELDRIKAKIRSIWNQILVTMYESEHKSDDDIYECELSLEEYLKENALFFPNEERPENELDGLLDELDSIFDEKEQLEPVKSEGKAPDYKGKTLPAHKEGLKVEKTVYKEEHKQTKTPSDSKEVIKSRGYEKPSEGKEPKSKDHEKSQAEIKSLLDILEVERKRLLKLVAKRNREFGVRL